MLNEPYLLAVVLPVLAFVLLRLRDRITTARRVLMVLGVVG
jgi:hypothetical protein